MKVLVNVKLSPHKYKTPEGYLYCQDAIIARTGKQTYMKSEIYPDSNSDELIEVDRPFEEVTNPLTIASFEDKPITCEHPDENVGPHNYNELAVGHTKNVRVGPTKIDGETVLLADLIITDAQAIEDIENNSRTDLSCGYDCDITDGANPKQINIRGNHVALCEQGRAGCARIVDSIVKDDIHTYYSTIRNQNFKIKGLPNHRIKMIYEDGKEEEKKESYFKELLQKQIIRIVDSVAKDTWYEEGYSSNKNEYSLVVSEQEAKALKKLHGGQVSKQKVFGYDQWYWSTDSKDIYEKVKNKPNAFAKIANNIEDDKLNWDTIKELKSDIYHAMNHYWETVFDDEWLDESSFSLEQDNFDEKLLIVKFKPRKEAYFRTETSFEKFKARLTIIPGLKLKKIYKKSVKVSYYDNDKFTRVDGIVFQYIGQMADSATDNKDGTQSQIDKLIGEEEDAIKSYQAAIDHVKKRGDTKTVELLTHIMEEEIEHKAELEMKAKIADWNIPKLLKDADNLNIKYKCNNKTLCDSDYSFIGSINAINKLKKLNNKKLLDVQEKIINKPTVKDSVSKGTLIQEFGKNGSQYKIIKIEKNTVYAEDIVTNKLTLFRKDKQGIDWDCINKSDIKDSMPNSSVEISNIKKILNEKGIDAVIRESYAAIIIKFNDIYDLNKIFKVLKDYYDCEKNIDTLTITVYDKYKSTVKDRIVKARKTFHDEARFSRKFYIKALDALQRKLDRLEKNKTLDANNKEYELQKNRYKQQLQQQIELYKNKIKKIDEGE